MSIKLFGTPDQIQVIKCPIRFISVFAGRRWGKSTTIDNRIITQTLTKPKFRYWYISPTYAQVLERFRALAFAPGLQRFIRNTKLQPYPEIELVNDSYIGYRTFERPQNLRGSGLNEIAVDEIQDINEQQFWPVLRPLLSDRRGSLLIAGQFRGYNWYYEQFYLPGQDPRRAGFFKSFRFPSATGLMYQGELGRQELELARQQIPRVIFQQEYECEPVANQNAVFDPNDLKIISRDGQHSGPYILGLDLGRVKDPSAIVVLSIPTGTVVHAESIQLGTKHEVQAQIVARIARQFNARVVLDATGGATGGQEKTDAYLQFYRKLIPDIKPFYWQKANKERIIHHLALEIEQHRLSIPPRFTDLHKELMIYEFEYKTGFYDYHAPVGYHDDYVSALAMATWARHNNWGPNMSGAPLGTLY